MPTPVEDRLARLTDLNNQLQNFQLGGAGGTGGAAVTPQPQQNNNELLALMAASIGSQFSGDSSGVAAISNVIDQRRNDRQRAFQNTLDLSQLKMRQLETQFNAMKEFNEFLERKATEESRRGLLEAETKGAEARTKKTKQETKFAAQEQPFRIQGLELDLEQGRSAIDANQALTAQRQQQMDFAAQEQPFRIQGLEADVALTEEQRKAIQIENEQKIKNLIWANENVNSPDPITRAMANQVARGISISDQIQSAPSAKEQMDMIVANSPLLQTMKMMPEDVRVNNAGKIYNEIDIMTNPRKAQFKGVYDIINNTIGLFPVTDEQRAMIKEANPEASDKASLTALPYQAVQLDKAQSKQLIDTVVDIGAVTYPSMNDDMRSAFVENVILDTVNMLDPDYVGLEKKVQPFSTGQKMGLASRVLFQGTEKSRKDIAIKQLNKIIEKAGGKPSKVTDIDALIMKAIEAKAKALTPIERNQIFITQNLQSSLDSVLGGAAIQ